MSLLWDVCVCVYLSVQCLFSGMCVCVCVSVLSVSSLGCFCLCVCVSECSVSLLWDVCVALLTMQQILLSVDDHSLEALMVDNNSTISDPALMRP